MSSQILETARIRRLIPLTKWNDYHPWPTVAGLRHLVFHEHSNGFSTCVRRVGRRVLIDEAEFFRWTDDQNGVDDIGNSGINGLDASFLTSEAPG